MDETQDQASHTIAEGNQDQEDIGQEKKDERALCVRIEKRAQMCPEIDAKHQDKAADNAGEPTGELRRLTVAVPVEQQKNGANHERCGAQETDKEIVIPGGKKVQAHMAEGLRDRAAMGGHFE